MFHEFRPWRDCDHGYGRPSWRPRVSLRQAQDKFTLRRTIQVRLGANPLWLPGGATIFMVSPQQFMKHPGYGVTFHRSRYFATPNIFTVALVLLFSWALFWFNNHNLAYCNESGFHFRSGAYGERVGTAIA